MKGDKLVSSGILGVFLGMIATGICIILDRSPNIPLLGQFISTLIIIIGLEKNFRAKTKKTIEETIVGDDLNVYRR